MFRKMLATLLVLAVILSFSSCNYFDMNVEELIHPPRYDKDTYPIQKALETVAGKNITLKYPLSGNYRSAFIFKDLDGDSINEAVVLYSTNTDGTVYMHLNVIALDGDEWVSKSDIKLVGSDIEKIMFSDLNNDTFPEIIVGWMIYGTVDKQVGIYTYDGKMLNQRSMEKYSNFLCGGLTSATSNELIVINLNTTEKTSVVKVLSFVESSIAISGSTMIDGGVTSYSTPIISTLKDGRQALYIDAVKGTGALTEIVWFDGDVLKSVYDSTLAETSLTYRPSSVASADFNNDKLIEIPVMRELKSTENKSEENKVYVTSWCNYDGKNLIIVDNTFMNYSDGYYLSIPNNWLDKIHLARKTDSRLRIFYSYDPATDTQGDECFRIVAATQNEINDGKYKNTEYKTLGSYGGMVYLVKIAENNELGITQEVLIESFHIINQEKEEEK